MGQISVQIGGRSYVLACRDGEEPHLEGLANYLSGKATELTASLGSMSEPRLLLMAGILIADELFEHQRAGTTETAVNDNVVEPARLETLTRRIEALALVLESDLPAA